MPLSVAPKVPAGYLEVPPSFIHLHVNVYADHLWKTTQDAHCIIWGAYMKQRKGEECVSSNTFDMYNDLHREVAKGAPGEAIPILLTNYSLLFFFYILIDLWAPINPSAASRFKWNIFKRDAKQCTVNQCYMMDNCPFVSHIWLIGLARKS